MEAGVGRESRAADVVEGGSRSIRLSARRLHLILLPTEACNFRCAYCYEDFRHGPMAPSVVRGIKNLLTRRAQALETLHLSWFGGEPLLARGVIEDVMMHVRALAEANPRLRADSDVTTNGYHLKPAVATGLLDLGVTRFQISFDGPREWHDRRRVRVGGRGTFDAIWGNLVGLRARDGDFRVTLRVHVDRENLPGIPRFLDLCAEAFASDSRFEVFLREISRLGGANDRALAVLGEDEREATLGRLREYARSRGLRAMELSATDDICYAARPSSYVVRANGEINKCTVSLRHPNNRVGRLLEDGAMRVEGPKMLMWMRGFVTGNAAELKCPMRHYAEPHDPEAAPRSKRGLESYPS